METPVTDRAHGLTSFIIAALILVVLASLIFDCTLDDSFISFVYARHLAQGEGLVFNPGQRVEGYSNLLWVLVAAAFEVLRADTVIMAKIVGIACAILGLLLTGEIARRHLKLGPAVIALGLVFLATDIRVVYYSISGMETTFYLLQVVLLSYLLLEDRFVPAGGVCGALILTRPEGILFIIPLAVTLVAKRTGLRTAVTALLIPIGVAVTFEAWRWHYYGALLPNTHLHKVDMSGSFARFVLLHTKALVMYSLRGFSGTQMVLGAAVLGIGILGRKRLLPLSACVLMAVVFVWYSGGDWTAFSRFYVPVLPLIALFWMGAVGFMVERAGRTLHRRALLVGLMLVPLLISALHTATSFLELERMREIDPAMNCKAHTEIARYLERASAPGDRVAINEPGAIGYYTGLVMIDISGRTDRTTARLEREGQLAEFAEHILSTEPRFVFLNNRQYPWDTDLHPSHRAILEKMQETGLYARERTFELSYYKDLILYVRKERPDLQGNQALLSVGDPLADRV